MRDQNFKIMHKYGKNGKKRAQSAMEKREMFKFSNKKNKKDYIVKNYFDINPMKIYHEVMKMKKNVAFLNKNKENKANLIPMTFNVTGGYDNESLEVELHFYKSKLKKEAQNYQKLVKELESIQNEISHYEKVIEENKFLFQKKKNMNSKKSHETLEKNKNKDYIDNHTQSLLKMMKKKHKNLEDKLLSKEKEFKELQKGFEFTELKELLSEIEELKKETERIENLPDKVFFELDENDSMVLSNIMGNNQSDNQKHHHPSKMNSLYKEYASEHHITNSNKKQKKHKKEKKQKRHQSKEKRLNIDEETNKKTFLINHLILENLRTENKRIYDELQFLTNDNLNLEKINSTIEENIKLQNITLEKLKIEYKQKQECFTILQNKENIQKFQSHEKSLKKKLNEKQKELSQLIAKLEEKDRKIKEKEKELQKINQLYEKAVKEN